jgi:hypothetical protein
MIHDECSYFLSGSTVCICICEEIDHQIEIG